MGRLCRAADPRGSGRRHAYDCPAARWARLSARHGVLSKNAGHERAWGTAPLPDRRNQQSEWPTTSAAISAPAEFDGGSTGRSAANLGGALFIVGDAPWSLLHGLKTLRPAFFRIRQRGPHSGRSVRLSRRLAFSPLEFRHDPASVVRLLCARRVPSRRQVAVARSTGRAASRVPLVLAAAYLAAKFDPGPHRCGRHRT